MNKNSEKQFVRINTILVKDSGKPHLGHEILIALAPALLIALWFVAIDEFELYVSSNLSNRFLTATFPAILATCLVGIFRVFDPIVVKAKLLFMALLPSIIIYPILVLWFIFRYRIAADGAMILIYEFAIGMFWLIVSVALATILGSSLGRRLRKAPT